MINCYQVSNEQYMWLRYISNFLLAFWFWVPNRPVPFPVPVGWSAWSSNSQNYHSMTKHAVTQLPSIVREFGLPCNSLEILHTNPIYGTWKKSSSARPFGCFSSIVCKFSALCKGLGKRLLPSRRIWTLLVACRIWTVISLVMKWWTSWRTSLKVPEIFTERC